MSDVAIYALIDPRDGRCRYVGKTKGSLQARLRAHIADAKRRPKEAIGRFRWINKLADLGLTPSVRVLELVHADDWQLAEQMWVAEMRGRFGDLLNATDGGDGIHGHVHSDSTKRAQSNSARARYAQPGERERTGASVKAALNRPEVKEKLLANARKKFSDPQFIQRLSDRSRAYSNLPEVRAARSEKLKGRVITQEWREKISASKKGIKPSEQTRKKLSAARIGKKHSQETIAKMREARAKRQPV